MTKDRLAGHCRGENPRVERRATNGRGPRRSSCCTAAGVTTESGKVWMGWERKRGKLLDFNELLSRRDRQLPGESRRSASLHGVRYVITLDSDTQLPRDTAQRLVGAMAHPLNRADDRSRHQHRAPQATALLQPRVGISVHSAVRIAPRRIYSGQTGFDIYTRAVSDVYQDLFARRHLHRKGHLRRRRLPEGARATAFPTNALLSHDLIEGFLRPHRPGLRHGDDRRLSFALRAPTSQRKHRWVRGDWQILRWLFPRVPTASGGLVAESALADLAVEDLRQPAPQPAGSGAARAAGLRLAVPAGRATVLDRWRC